MNKYLTLIVLTLFTTVAIGQNTAEDMSKHYAAFDAQVEKITNESVGVGVAILSPDLGIDYVGVAGYDGRNKASVMKEDQPFRIASITKTFVSVTLLLLDEQGKISINDPISKYISDAHSKLLRSGGYNSDLITIKSCMNHTSSLFDYAMAKPDYQKLVAADPMYRWTRTEQIALAMKIGKPVNKKVGAEYHYSDTGYVLLGEIIEKVTGKGLALAMRETIDYKKLGLNSTWLETLETHPRDKERRVRRYLEEHDATDWDPSLDLYGGGGLMSTTSDMARFMNALFMGQVFSDSTTLERMLEKPALKKKADKDYRLGIIYRDFGSITAYMHSGLWGAYLIYFPSLRATMALNYTDSNDRATLGPLAKEVVNAKKELTESTQ